MTELKKLIREEYKIVLQEDIFDKWIDRIFKKLKDQKTKAAMKAMESDPEYQKRKAKLEKSVASMAALLKYAKERGPSKLLGQ